MNKSMNRVTQKIKEATLDEAKSLSNTDLLEEVVSSAGGDDYDGCFTNVGEYRFGVMRDELNDRLRSIGFLPATHPESEENTP